MNKRSRVLARLKLFPVQFSEESMTFDTVGAVLISESFAGLLLEELEDEISGVAANLEKEMRKSFNVPHSSSFTHLQNAGYSVPREESRRRVHHRLHS
jgi:hypothetical protein